MLNIMLDLETLGTKPGCVILAIGAVAFDLDTGEQGQTFYRTIDPNSCVKRGLQIEANTVMWWMQQSEEARAAFRREGEQLDTVLCEFGTFVDNIQGYGNEAKIWGNGADFDNTILATAYEACGYRIPWKFWNNRCYRTIKSMNPKIKLERIGVHHNALSDAVSQADHLCKILKANR